MFEEHTFVKLQKLSHFITRLMERFAIAFDKSELPRIVEQIESYEIKPIFIKTDGKSFHPVIIAGQNIIVLYDWEYQTPLSAFHPSWFKQDENGTWEQVKTVKAKSIRYHNRRGTLRNKFKGGRP